MIDFAALEKALAQLETSVRYLESESSRKDAELRLQFRAATIQAFEITYELAVKLLDRQAAALVANPGEFKAASFKEKLRTAHGLGLLRDAMSFVLYREKRNETSHTYDAAKAEHVLSVVPAFLEDVRHLVGQLHRHNRAAD